MHAFTASTVASGLRDACVHKLGSHDLDVFVSAYLATLSLPVGGKPSKSRSATTTAIVGRGSQIMSAQRQF